MRREDRNFLLSLVFFLGAAWLAVLDFIRNDHTFNLWLRVLHTALALYVIIGICILYNTSTRSVFGKREEGAIAVFARTYFYKSWPASIISGAVTYILSLLLARFGRIGAVSLLFSFVALYATIYYVTDYYVDKREKTTRLHRRVAGHIFLLELMVAMSVVLYIPIMDMIISDVAIVCDKQTYVDGDDVTISIVPSSYFYPLGVTKIVYGSGDVLVAATSKPIRAPFLVKIDGSKRNWKSDVVHVYFQASRFNIERVSRYQIVSEYWPKVSNH